MKALNIEEIKRGKADYIEVRNLDLDEPVCVDADGNAMNEYEEGKECDCIVRIRKNGYAYLVIDGIEQEEYCMSDQDIFHYLEDEEVVEMAEGIDIVKDIIRPEAEMRYEVVNIFPCDFDYPQVWNSTHPNAETTMCLWDMRNLEYDPDYTIQERCAIRIAEEKIYAVEIMKEKAE